jgi:hypothetical protein
LLDVCSKDEGASQLEEVLKASRHLAGRQRHLNGWRVMRDTQPCFKLREIISQNERDRNKAMALLAPLF